MKTFSKLIFVDWLNGSRIDRMALPNSPLEDTFFPDDILRKLIINRIHQLDHISHPREYTGVQWYRKLYHPHGDW